MAVLTGWPYTRDNIKCYNMCSCFAGTKKSDRIIEVTVRRGSTVYCLKTREFGEILIDDLIICLKTCSSSFMLKISFLYIRVARKPKGVTGTCFPFHHFATASIAAQERAVLFFLSMWRIHYYNYPNHNNYYHYFRIIIIMYTSHR